MTDNLFDKFIKDKLTDHSSPVPADMWARIQPQDDADKRGAFWWKTVGLVLLMAVGLVGGFMLWNNNASKTNDVAAKENPSIANTSTENGGQNSNDNSVAAPGVKNVDGATNAGESDADGKIPQPGNAASSNNLLVGYNGISDNSKIGSAHKKLSFSISRKYTAKKNSAKNTTTPDLVFNNGSSVDAIPSNTNDYSLTDFNKNYQSFLSTTAIEEKKLAQQKKVELSNQLSKYNFSCLVDCPSARGPQRNDWYLELFASPDYARKTIVKSTGVSDDYLKRKDSSETLQAAFTAGFRLSKTLGEKMLIKSGLQYSQINEKFNYRTENERRITTVVTIRTIIRGPGDTIMVRDTSSLEQIGYRVKTASNRYRSIDVPVILSYEWGGEKLKASVNAGVILNLYSWQKGEMLDTSFTPVSFNKIGTGQTFKQNLGIGFYAGFSLLKPIGNNLEIFAEPYFRYNINNMTKDKNPFTQKFNVAGINLGIRYKLSSNGQHYPGR